MYSINNFRLYTDFIHYTHIFTINKCDFSYCREINISILPPIPNLISDITHTHACTHSI